MNIIAALVMEQPGDADIVSIVTDTTHFEVEPDTPLVFDSRTRRGDGIALVKRLFPDAQITKERINGDMKITRFQR